MLGKHTSTWRTHQNHAHLLRDGSGLGSLAAMGETLLQLLNARLELVDDVLETVDGLVRDGSHFEL